MSDPLSPTPPPLPVLPYAARQPKLSRKRFSWGIFAWSGAVVGLWLMMLWIVLPRFEQTLQEYKLEVPVSTRAIYAVQRITSKPIGLAMAASIPLALGLIAGPLSPGGKRAFRLIVTLMLGGLIAWTVVAIFQPITTLMEGLTKVRQ